MLMHCEDVETYYCTLISPYSEKVKQMLRFLPSIGSHLSDYILEPNIELNPENDAIADILSNPDVDLKYKKNIAHIVTRVWRSTSVETFYNVYKNYRAIRANRLRGLI